MQLETERLRILPLPQLKLRLEGMPRFEHEAMASPAELAEKIPSSCPWAAKWQIIWKERNCSVGSAGFMNVPDETGEVEIRCGITPAFQRRGFMTEALRAIAAWALEQPGVTGVIAETEPENTASRRVLARCGFKPVSATRWRRLGPAEITYRELPAGEIETGLFASFNRYQEVKRCPAAPEINICSSRTSTYRPNIAGAASAGSCSGRPAGGRRNCGPNGSTSPPIPPKRRRPSTAR